MAEKRVIELEIQDNSKTLKAQYKEAVLEVQRLADAYGETSQQVANAAKKAADLKDKIEDTNDAIAAFKGEGKFVAAGKALSAVASGFSAVEGGMALLGVESENLQKTMLKVQAAMALAQGLEGLEDAGRAFKQLGVVATNALKGVKGAIAATGIGLLVVALGTIVAYWDDIKSAVNGVSTEQEKLNKLSYERYINSKEELDNLDKQDNILKLQGKSEREILNIKIKKSIQSIDAAKEDLINIQKTSDAEEKAALRNYKYAMMFAKVLVDQALFLPKLMMIPIDLAIKGANKISEALGLGKLVTIDLDKSISDLGEKAKKFIAGSIINYDEVKAENDKTKKETADTIKELENKKAGYELSLKEISKQNREENYNDRKAELDALIELETRNEFTNKERLTKLYEERLKLDKLKGAELELAQQQNADKIREAIEEDNKKVISLETKKFDKLGQIRHDNLQTLQGQLNLEVQAEIDAAMRKQQILESQAANAERIDKKAHSFKVEAAKSALDTIASLTELFGKKSEKAARKAFEVQKAANIASALITTYQNATSAYASQFVPIPDPSSPIRGGVAAGIAVATGLINVAKIASQKFEGGGSMAGGAAPSSAGGGGITAPSFNVIGSSGVNQLAQIQQQPTRAYVVSGDIATGLSLERNRLQNASF